jgi:NTE family protein
MRHPEKGVANLISLHIIWRQIKINSSKPWYDDSEIVNAQSASCSIATRHESKDTICMNRRLSIMFSVALIALMSILYSSRSLCDTPTDKANSPRPKIGLALAGGSALGFSHVGVLLWFEEHHIPVDYIAGTSMGALIGGGYATGMSAAEIRDLLTKQDWNNLLQSEPPYSVLTFRRREDRHAFPNSLQFGWKNGSFSAPSGLNSGHPIGLLLSEICLPYTPLSSFDSLPTPFRCTAVDMESGRSTEFSSGSLETALRSSMAIPGYFTPVLRDGRLYGDGGLLNNLPTESVRNMGADVVIAVSLTNHLPSRQQFLSFTGMLGQASSIAVLSNERESIKLANIAIIPDLSGLAIFEFSRVDDFIKRGYAAADAQSAALIKYRLSDEEWSEYVAKRREKRRSPFITPQFIDIAGVSGVQADQVKLRLQDFMNKPLNQSALSNRLTQITGDGRYDSLNYQREARDGKDGLGIGVEPKAYGPPFVKMELNVNGSNSDHVLTTFSGRSTSMSSNGDEIRTDMSLGSDTSLSMEGYHPLQNSRLFLAPRVGASKSEINLYAGGNSLLETTQTNNEAAFDVGYNANSRSQARLGLSVANFNESIASQSFNGGLTQSYAKFEYDGMDNGLESQKGVRASTALKEYIHAPGSSGDFTTFEAKTVCLTPILPKISLLTMASGGSAFGSQVPIPQKFMLGGPFNMSAYGSNQFEGNSYYHILGGALYNVLSLPAPISTQASLAAWVENAGIFDNGQSAIHRSDVAVGSLLITPVCPILIGFGYGKNWSHNFFFSVGSVVN